MLAEKPEIAQTIIAHRYPIEDAPEAFRAAAGGTPAQSRSSSSPDAVLRSHVLPIRGPARVSARAWVKNATVD